MTRANRSKLPRHEGGLTAPFFSIYVAAAYADKGAAKKALELIDLTKRVVADHPNEMMSRRLWMTRAPRKRRASSKEPPSTALYKEKK